ncbi:MAG: glutathione peroxidase [Bacteroidetes bacterium]|nr:glutathione peroxidase [Bacteroidota bacterium]MCW5895872.1 glutathione peroxidase [Bacteroidota bacterium]
MKPLFRALLRTPTGAFVIITMLWGSTVSSLAGSQNSIYNFSMKDIDGREIDFSRYQGKVLLLVNVASECGYTPQYKELEALHQKYKDKGLIILGFPANNFGGQEPGADEEINAFCDRNYGVTFDLFSKISVKGSDQHPLYKLITSNPTVGGDVKWNFQKYLVDRNGNLTHKFLSRVKPLSDELVSAVEALLNEK